MPGPDAREYGSAFGAINIGRLFSKARIEGTNSGSFKTGRRVFRDHFISEERRRDDPKQLVTFL